MKLFNRGSLVTLSLNILCTALATVILTSSIPAQAEQEPAPQIETPAWWKEIKVDLSPEYFYWREDYGGMKLLDESGFRIGLEASYHPLLEQGWIWASRLKFYFGAVDYNGGVQLASGATMPLKSTTDYYGALGEAGYGYRFRLGQDYSLDLLGRLSLDFWLRHLGSQYGYNEYWFPISLKAGLDLTPRQTGWVGNIGLKVPVYTYQTVDFGRLGGGTVTLHPRTMVTPYAEAGYQLTKNFSIEAFFDSYWFKQSSVNQGILQPESKSYEVGAKIGWNF